jgi:hypothetical protein
MLANAAFIVGATLGVAPHMPEVIERFDFESLRSNFYRAAQQGLDAQLAWPSELGGTGEFEAARDILPRLAGFAREGLAQAEVESEDSDPLIDTFVDRVRAGRTGATWQRKALTSLEAHCDRPEALANMLDRYLAHARDGAPVHEWPLP